jgi:hypothetical protein
VKPQSAALLEKSRQFLAKAQDLLNAHRWPDEAGRARRIAGLHAAQALVFESTGKAVRSQTAAIMSAKLHESQSFLPAAKLFTGGGN